MLDFSKIDDLKPLARLVARINSLRPESTFLIAGAQARDLLLKYAYGIDTARRTSDVDFAFRVSSWDEFREIRSALIASGDFTECPKELQKLKFCGVLEVDIVPFGDIEKPNRTIAWPPDWDFEMSTFGFKEILGSVIDVQLPEGQSVKVVSLAALALLKLEAWKDRRRREPGKDAHDLGLILKNYLMAGNEHRIYGEFEDLMTEDFDYTLAGAYVLGWDIAAFLDDQGKKRIGEMLEQQANANGKLDLITDMRLGLDEGVRLISARRDGFNRSRPA